MNERDVLRLALDYIVESNKSSQFWLVPASNLNKTVNAIKEVLAQPEQESVNYKKLAALGWQAIECPFCGSSGAQAFSKPKQEPEWYHGVDEHGCNRFYHKTEVRPSKFSNELYTTPPQRKPLPPKSPCEMTQAEGKMFKLGWLECEAAHGIKE
jgi:hypothetical protein